MVPRLRDAVLANVVRAEEEVRRVYLGSTTCLLVHDTGELRYVSDGPGLELDARTLRDACALKRASLVLGNALGRGVSATHARSETSVISSFDVGERHVFVVASEMREVAAELFDARAAETALAGVLEALARDLDPGNKRGA